MEKGHSIPVLDRGYVQFLDNMGDDNTPVNAARVSYGKGTKTVSDDKSLINYLIRHQHSSVLEQVVFQFRIKAPIFVIRQIFRHRSGSPNEYSGRYSEMLDEFYVPTEIRGQSPTNKQVGGNRVPEEVEDKTIGTVEGITETVYCQYKNLLDLGVCREQARIVLPVNQYSIFYWTQNLRNLLHLLELRLSPNTQWETRQYAEAMASIVKEIVPITYEAWENHVLNSERFSCDELNILIPLLAKLNMTRSELESHVSGILNNKRRVSEFMSKVEGGYYEDVGTED